MKIKNKINISFMLTFVLISSLVGLIVGIYTTSLVKNNIFSYLHSSNRARAEHTRTFIQDQKKTAVILAAASVYLDFLKEPTNSSQYPIIKEKVAKRFVRTLEADPQIYEVLIMGLNGKVLISSDFSQEGADESEDDYFLEGKKGVFVKDVYVLSRNNKLTYGISAPIKDSSGALLGVSMLRYEPSLFYSIVKNENGLGDTEENFLVNKDKFFITPSRFLGEEVILKQKVDTQNVKDCFDPAEIEYVSKNGYGGTEEAIGHDILEAKDYRNVDVIATHSYVPETGWCLITKVDKSDAMSFRNTLILIFLSIFVSGGFIYLFIGILISRSISNPIKNLALETKLLTKEFSTTTTTTTTKESKDEISILKQAFNTMATELKKSYNIMEDKIRERTEKISSNAKDLEEQKSAILNILEDVEKEKNKAEELSIIVRDANESIVSQDLEGKILNWNHGAENLYGYEKDEMIGKSITTIIPEDKREEYQNIKKTIIAGNKIDHYQTVRRKKDGTLVDVAISISPIKDSGGKVVGLSVITLDITKEKEIDKAKTEFVSLASHQLRTPLSAINWYTEMLLAGDAGAINEEQKKYLNEVAIGNKRMVDLVDSLLNVSRLDLGTFMIEPEKVDVLEMAKSVVGELTPQIKQKNLKLEELYDDKVEFDADKKLLRIILQNFLSNAVKYTPDGGTIKLNIKFIKKGENFGEKEVAEDGLGFSVSDSGMGIPANQQDKIFLKLFRADNARESETEGTGLGLYIVKSIIDQSGGNIWFKSEEGKGSTFYMVFPQGGMKKKEGTKKLD